MNVFSTDHPMTCQPPLTPRWFRRSLFFVFVYYPLYLAILGPFWALDGPGYLKFLPETVRVVIYSPALLVSDLPVLGSVFEAYMDCWYYDPNTPEALP